MAHTHPDLRKPRKGKLEGAKVNNESKVQSNSRAGQTASQPTPKQSGDPRVPE